MRYGYPVRASTSGNSRPSSPSAATRTIPPRGFASWMARCGCGAAIPTAPVRVRAGHSPKSPDSTMYAGRRSSSGPHWRSTTDARRRWRRCWLRSATTNRPAKSTSGCSRWRSTDWGGRQTPWRRCAGCGRISPTNSEWIQDRRSSCSNATSCSRRPPWRRRSHRRCRRRRNRRACRPSPRRRVVANPPDGRTNSRHCSVTPRPRARPVCASYG